MGFREEEVGGADAAAVGRGEGKGAGGLGGGGRVLEGRGGWLWMMGCCRLRDAAWSLCKEGIGIESQRSDACVLRGGIPRREDHGWMVDIEPSIDPRYRV